MTTTSQEALDTLNKIKQYESDHAVSQWPGGWTGTEVGIPPAHVDVLDSLGAIVPVKDEDGRMVDVTRSSATGYRLSSVNFFLDIDRVPTPSPSEEPVVLPQDLFASIVGYDEVKELLVAALLSPKPVHVLLVGPPALAKSLFLWDIERAYSQSSLWLLGSATSQTAMWDMVAEAQPQVLLFDEFEKMKVVDQSALLSLMEGGRLVRAKVGRRLDLTVECRVFAAANSLHRLTPELLSRFARQILHPYQAPAFRQVVASVLVEREGVDEEMAQEIGELLVGRTQDVRDAIRVARLSHQLGAKRAVELLGLLDTD